MAGTSFISALLGQLSGAAGWAGAAPWVRARRTAQILGFILSCMALAHTHSVLPQFPQWLFPVVLCDVSNDLSKLILRGFMYHKRPLLILSL